MPCILAVEPKVLATTVYHLELIVLVYYLLSANFTVVYSRAFPVLFGCHFSPLLCGCWGGEYECGGSLGSEVPGTEVAVGTGAVWWQLSL